MERLLFTNNAESTAVGSGGVVGGILSLGGTSLNLYSGTGSLFPSPGSGEAFLLTIYEKPAGVEENVEVVKVTSRTADNLTIVRGVEGTSYGYPTVAGRTVYVALRLTALGVGQFLQSDQNLADLDNAATARTNLGLAIGTNVQAYDPDLTTWAGKTAPSGDVVGTTDTQALTNKTLTTPAITDPVITGCIQEDIYTITDGAAFEIDPGNGSVQLITLGANRTPKATNFTNGEAITLMVLDGTAYTLTWTDATMGGSGVVWVGGSAPTLDTTKYTVIQLWKVGGQVYGVSAGAA